MKVSRLTVSPTFRKMVEDAYPTLNLSSSYWRMMKYLLFATRLDEETKQPLLSKEVCAAIEGKEIALQNHRYTAAPFLEAFKRDVLPEFEWIEYSRVEGKARCVASTGIAQHILEARELELQGQWKYTGRVYFDDGTVYSPKTAKKERELTKMEAITRMSQAGNETATKLLDYMNSLPVHRFNEVLNNINEAVFEAFKLPEYESRNHQISLLRHIADQPQPYYRPTEKSVRVFGFNESMLQLRKEVRRKLTPNWTEFDVESSQLAIIATQWDIPELKEFLQQGRNIWQEFYDYFSIRDEIKSSVKKYVLKPGLYGTVFGMARKNIVSRLDKEFENYGIQRGGLKFVRHPLIAIILKARAKKMKEVEQAGGAMTIYGEWLSTKDYSVPSILAQLAQAAELKLLEPVIDLARGTEDFAIVLWQHDGFSVDFKQRKERWTERIIEAVNKQANDLGFITKLVIS